ncbi:SOS response-associated peptidase family protein [Oceanicoccus sp. KOV_DT_Chl]|uniref:SOS response-associated peptidase family protein n=1 Tax=Oceanicoccus sp. KOV_DT_Chl TaxID=1904639 RepID=UPI000C7B23B7|nr:SOS response-associated peptidase family protein [Oceanicoccus sp. KOV_DT_Chl]
MCTNFVLIKKKSIVQLAGNLGVNADELHYQPHAKPGAVISIITATSKGNTIKEAIWWLFLKQTETGLKPHPDYFSVNTRYDKLASRPEFRTSRCIIPATAFMESQDGKRPHLLEPIDDSAIAFGGLFKEWTDKLTGEVVISASIITLPGHPALANIHRKSTPLWLSENQFEQWLDCDATPTSALNDFLIPKLHTDLKATPIDKMSTRHQIGEPIRLAQMPNH